MTGTTQEHKRDLVAQETDCAGQPGCRAPSPDLVSRERRLSTLSVIFQMFLPSPPGANATVTVAAALVTSILCRSCPCRLLNHVVWIQLLD